KVR
ncbi:alanine-glyoxylate amino-transferase family protein, partial [Vibrio parahaemolyticus EKP-028]